MGNPFGSKNQTSTGSTSGSSTTTLSPEVKAAYDRLLAQSGNLSNTSAGNPTVNSAAAGLGNLASTANPDFAAGASALTAAENPAYNTVQQYLSPYLQDVLQANIASQNEQNAEQQQGVIGNAISKGALGGNRVAVAQGELARQQDIVNQATNAGILNTGYQQAMGAAQTGQSNLINAGSGLINAGSAGTQAGLSTLLGQLGAGEFQQSAPYQNLGTLAGATSALSNSGATVSSKGTSSSTQPAGNWLSSLLGLGTSIAGMWANGGVVPHMAAGGIPSFDDMGQALSAAVSGASQLAQQQPQSDSSTQPTQQQQRGQSNIGGWLHTLFQPQGLTYQAPGQAASAVDPWGGMRAHGGVVSLRPAYGPGGFVGDNSDQAFDLGGFLGNLFQSPPSSLDQARAIAAKRSPPAIPPPDIAPEPPMPATPEGAVSAAAGASAANSAANNARYNPMGAMPNPATTPPVPATPAPSPAVPPVTDNVVPLATPRTPNPGIVAAMQPGAGVVAPQSSAVGAINAAAPAGGFPGKMTVADMNKNPGNITDSPWTRKQPGYIGHNGDFAVFATPQDGRNAQISLLNSYASSGNDTVAGMVSKWAPQAANAGTPGSTANYINYVSSRLGVDPNQPVDPSKFPQMADVMSEFETGRRASGALGPDVQSAYAGNNGNIGNIGNNGPGAGLPPSLTGNNAGNNSGASGVIPNPMSTSGQPGGGIPGGLGVTPPGGYGIPDTNQGYSTGIGQAIQSLMAGHGLNLSPDARMGLLSAGAGMLAGTSPNGFTNIGTGMQQGIDTWMKKQDLNRQNATAESDIGNQQGLLGLEGTRVGQAAQQLYLNALDTAAQIHEITPSPAGVLNINKATGDIGFKPYNEITGAPQASQNQAPVTPITQPTQGLPEAGNHADPAEGFDAEPPAQIPVNGMLMTPMGQGIASSQTSEALTQARTDYTAGRTMASQLDQMKDAFNSLPQSGPLSSGWGANERASLAKTANSILQVAGIQPYFDASTVGSYEDLNKLTTRFGFDLARTLGQREAATIVNQAQGAVPGAENTAQGFKRIVGGLEAAVQRSSDYYNFLQKWVAKTGGDVTGADEYFNSINPPEKYSNYALIQSAIHPKSQADIDNAPSGSLIYVDGKLMKKP